ncbi:MAG TPA: acetyl-CoA hydrolase/transferase C-terminal domain-containing protein [Cyclobacteriaceae bacterium]
MTQEYISSEKAIQHIKSRDRVFIHGSAATPHHLLKSLAKAAASVQNVELIAVSTLGEMDIAKPEFGSSFYFNSLFVSDNVREAINSDRGEYIPIFLSEISKLFEKEILNLDVALIHVSPPDKHGFCSLGTSVDVARSAVHHSKKVIAQVNPNMPRTHGDSFVHISKFDAIVECNDPLPEVLYGPRITEQDLAIGKYCAELIEDRSTLQMGIGCIPDAVLKSLGHCKDLGVHTEMFSDGVIDLIKKGVITNRFKEKHPGKVVTSFAIGSKELYGFIDDNPQFEFLEADYVNDTRIIRSNPNVVAINSALEVDLTGQVCSDSIGAYHYSGVGGQMDFIRGASLSENGKPIIALRSTTKNGQSKLVPFLKQGAGVVTTRAHVHYVITEYGVAYLYGKNLHQRALELVKIAHPDHRDELDEEVSKRFGSNKYFLDQ